MGADKLFYGKLEDVQEACMLGNPKLKDMCMACFDGEYKTGDIDEKVLKANADARRGQRSCGKVEDDFDGEEQLNLV